MRKIYLIVIFLLTCLHSFSQINWPAITKQAKPWARWWWQGSAVNKPDLTTNLETYSKAGIGGLEITPIYGVKGQEDKFIQYLSPQWVDMLTHTLHEAKRLDMGIDMANATGWPFGGPWIDVDNAAKNMVLENYDVKGNDSLKDVVRYIQQPMVSAEGKAPPINALVLPIASNKNLQALALDQVRFQMALPLQVLMAYGPNGEILNLTDKVDPKTSKLNWKAPAGPDWTLCAIFMGLHGKMVERAAPGGEGFVIDHFSQDALKVYLDRFDQAFKSKDVGDIRAFFNDSYEVDDARGQANFTPNFFDEFKKRRGYDLLTQLPALFSKENKNNARVLCDYRETISDLVLDNFTSPWHAWANGRSALIRNQSHGSPANILDLYSAIDIPETEGNEPLRYRFATSAAHVSGKKLASSESATWLNEHFTSSLGDVKLAIDKLLLGGVNHVFYHGISYSPPSAPWPGWLFYAAVHFVPSNPQWHDLHTLNEYIARCQSFLQSGRADNDVLLYYPIFDSFMEPGRNLLKHYDGMHPEFTGSLFEDNAQNLLDRGYSFDYISDKQIQASVLNGNSIKTTGGGSYKAIVVPGCKYMPLATFSQLMKLAEGGAQVIICKNLPADVPGLDKDGTGKAALTDLIAKLNFAKGAADVKKAVYGKGAVLMGDNLDKLLGTIKTRREPMVEKGLQFVRRNYGAGDYYFIANKSNKGVEGWVPLSGNAASVILFDPMFKVSGLARSRKVPAGGTEVYLQLQPGESCILQTSATAVKGNLYAYYKPTTRVTEIKGEWTVTFTEGGPELPAEAKQTSLTSWTELPGPEVKRFSGTAKYSITFNKPLETAAAWKLDLGKVYETAEVYLNGAKLATLLGPDFSYNIPATLLKPVNTLEVNVSNLMANRISDMDKRHIPYRIFYNTNFPARLRDNRGEDGLFTAIKWDPKPSGLVGPVRLVMLEKE
ncbi:glycosyl hydrolase [Mucilaginibacter sp. PPCGB 2223]|uniref:glycosyl hydrolase n=1 Tax=Mucilaginibacter sp. PPCGB 2223 TaxID=1886027 RepID=UPI0009F429AC|nr:glycosyl hydrolase [Mucilaginibacter sp. PPCGB 2223]